MSTETEYIEHPLMALFGLYSVLAVIGASLPLAFDSNALPFTTNAGPRD